VAQLLVQSASRIFLRIFKVLDLQR